MCYQKTADADEAVTDLAVMNEKGNYSEGTYEQMLKDQAHSIQRFTDPQRSGSIEVGLISTNHKAKTRRIWIRGDI